ncbi:MAG: M24 family metallopeptidase [Candidatus Aminicenantes bacterium]|nr:M24 family metallopeptidase [Candidatus Aminicenantes bacterium]
MFSEQTYADRRHKLRQQINSGILLFLGNDESPMNYEDNPFHYRQDSTFLYYFGLSHAGLNAVIDVDEDQDIIFGDDLTVEDIVWMGTQPSLKKRGAKAGVKNIQASQNLPKYLKKAQEKGRTIHFLPPYRAEHRLKLYDWLNIPPMEADRHTSEDFIKAVVDQRNYKSEEEIQEIEKAVNTSVEMHAEAMKMVRPGMNEAVVAGRVQQIAIAAGGDLSFPTIATIHGETLHNHYHGNRMESGDMFLLDAGAETAMGYAGDLSSTFPVAPTFTKRQREIFAVAFSAHEKAISALKPGTRFKDIHLLACKTIASGLKDLGFMRGDVEEAVAQGAHALFFPCGLGHMMGLDVHDMENLGEEYVGYAGEKKSTQFGLKSLRLGRELEPGFVLTIEPGIYFIPELIDMWKADHKFIDFINYHKVEEYKDFGGLRNEENFLITEDGYRLLGKPKPKSIEDVEATRK